MDISSVSSESDTDDANIDSNNGLSIFYTNADSVLNKKDELEVILRRKNPDLIIITEVFPKYCKSTDICESELVISGYEMIQSKVNEKSRGVCIYYKSNLTVELCNNLNKSCFQESCWCFVTLSNNEKLLIGGIYHSPSSTRNNTNRLIELINNATNEMFQHILILGDFNFPTINWSQ